jgi:phosphoglucomutase/phosphomannomutase
MPDSKNIPDLFSLVDEAVAAKALTAAAATNLKSWLTEPRYAEYADEVAAHVREGKWQQLDDVFWAVIPFGTAGRRGKMYPIGSNAINDRTIGESAQGLADYVKDRLGAGADLSCGIAYDTRHRSEHFARLCAEIMTAAGFQVYFLKGFRSTPELSFLVRYKRCSCGIMVSASHNPPSDNAVKVYWSTGGQVLPPHDSGIINRVMNTQEIPRADFDEMLAAGRIETCQDEVDAKFFEAVLTQAWPGPRDLKVIYSPLHGVGAHAAVPVLEKDGFTGVEVFGPHAQPDGNFPNVPDHVSNPENPAVFDAIIARAQEAGADLALATDPDCDRIGCAAPLTLAPDAPWHTLNGNQIGVLLADYVLENWDRSGRLTPQHFIVTTLVTTPMLRRIADSYGVRAFSDLLVGFKWIAGAIDEHGPELFLYGTEEAHGYMAGSYVRDKDGAVGSMLICELAAALKAENLTLHQKLDSLFLQHGVHAERTLDLQMPGSAGMSKMLEMMTALRTSPPREFGSIPVAQIRDYGQLTTTDPGGRSRPLVGPRSNLLIFDLDVDGTSVACRPSGTEPKIKFYILGYVPAVLIRDLSVAKRKLAKRLDVIETRLRKTTGST